MPRIPRAQQAGFVYHVINRGNGRATIFHKAQDYQAFLSILALAKARHPVVCFLSDAQSLSSKTFGEPDWQTTIAGLFGLESTMRPRGRPALSEMRK